VDSKFPVGLFLECLQCVGRNTHPLARYRVQTLALTLRWRFIFGRQERFPPVRLASGALVDLSQEHLVMLSINYYEEAVLHVIVGNLNLTQGNRLTIPRFRSVAKVTINWSQLCIVGFRDQFDLDRPFMTLISSPLRLKSLDILLLRLAIHSLNCCSDASNVSEPVRM
jgi:hypothetical protein